MLIFNLLGNFTMCLKNQPCDVIKMRKIRGEVADFLNNLKINLFGGFALVL